MSTAAAIDPNERKYTVREVVEGNMIGYKLRMVREFLRNGKLRGIAMSTGPDESKTKWLIPESAIREFLENNVVGASSGKQPQEKKNKLAK